MSIHRIFLDSQVLSVSDEEISEVELPHEDIKHLKAARICAGEQIAIIDAASDYFLCDVIKILGNTLKFRISSRHAIVMPSFNIDLFQGIPKAGKLEDIVRHGTEIGVRAFYPLKCKRSISKIDESKAKSKIDRLNKIAKSAAVQSGRSAIPVVEMPMSVNDASKMIDGYDACVIFWEEAESSCTLKEALSDAKSTIAKGDICNVCVFVGPEGGIDEEEIDCLMSACSNVHLSTMGPHILRTETAGVVGCALASYELGGMGSVPIERIKE